MEGGRRLGEVSLFAVTENGGKLMRGREEILAKYSYPLWGAFLVSHEDVLRLTWVYP